MEEAEDTPASSRALSPLLSCSGPRLPGGGSQGVRLRHPPPPSRSQRSPGLGCPVPSLTGTASLSAPSPWAPTVCVLVASMPSERGAPGPPRSGHQAAFGSQLGTLPGRVAAWLFRRTKWRGRGAGVVEGRKKPRGEEIDNLLHPNPQAPLPRGLHKGKRAERPPLPHAPMRKAGWGGESARGAEAPQGTRGSGVCTRRASDWTLVSGLRGGSLWQVNRGCAPGVVP